MTEIEHYYLVDLENVGLQGLYGLNMPGEGSEIQIFLSNAAHVGTDAIRQDILESRASFDTTFCSVTGKNALYFQLSAYFGAVLEIPATKRISIISKDGGYKSLEDYAWKRRKTVTVYQARSVLEAFVASENRAGPRKYEKGKSVDFKHIMTEVKARKGLEEPVRKALAELCDEEMIQKVLDITGSEGITARERYLRFLKTFGRVKGTELYRLLRGNKE